jgi:dGTP triphosphohydrolase
MPCRQLIESLEVSEIETNKQFSRLAEKTQVAFPGPGLSEVVRNRLTHSYEVATSASIMCCYIARERGWTPEMVDYRGSLRPASLLHDIGHPSFSHCGSEVLNEYFKAADLPEGFCDNSNSLVVIEKNDIMVSDYTMCSIIKYPDRLYPSQQERYIPMLEQAIIEDFEHFGAIELPLLPQTRTIACQIMDEADRNTYICSDLSDFLCLGHNLSKRTLKDMVQKTPILYGYTELKTLLMMLESGDKTAIKAYFNNLKNLFNMNYKLTSGGLTIINHDLHEYREFLWEVEFEHYISPMRAKDFHKENMAKFMDFIDEVTKNNFSPSRTYAKKIENSTNKLDLLRAQRDMIAEVTDLYITKAEWRTPVADNGSATTSC